MSTGRRLFALVCLLTLGGGAMAQEETLPIGDGKRVTSLEFEGNARLDVRYLGSLVEVRPGALLSESAVRSSLRSLFATNLFSDLAVAVAPDGDGLRVVVQFSSPPRIRQVIVPAGVPGRAAIREAIGVSAGEPFSADATDSGERGARRALEERGYFDARVTVSAEALEDPSEVLLKLDIRPGRRAIAGLPRFVGSLGAVDEKGLIKAGRLKPGSAYREDRARDDADRYLAALRRLGYLRAEVRFEERELDASHEVARARYGVFVGPRVVLAVVGAPESLVRDHNESPWSNGEPADEESLGRLAQAVRRTLQEKGFARARVELSSRVEATEEVHTFTVRRGDRYVVRTVDLEGVPAEDRRRVGGLLSTRARGFLEPGRLVDEKLSADREAILTSYRRRGFASVAVPAPSVEDGPDPFTLRVSFRVEAGPLFRISRIGLEGVGSVPEATLLGMLTVRVGDPLDPGTLAEDVERLRLAYAERGFLDARVESVVEHERQDGGPAVAAVRFVIREGRSARFGKTIVRGNWRTRTSVVTGEVAHHEGEPLTTSRLLETQENLSRLGVFSRVDMSLLPADPESGSRPVLIGVSEAKPWSLSYGIGGEYDEREPRFNVKPRLSLGVSYANLFGRALTASLDARYTPRETRFVATLRDRSLLGHGSPLSLTAFVTTEERTYKVDRRGAYLEAEKRLFPLFKGVLRYQYEIVESDADPLVLSPSERQNQNVAISSFGPGVVWDTRPDPTDPRSGVFLSVDGKYAFPWISADANFLKGFLAVTKYLPVGSAVVAASLRYGAIETFTSRCEVLPGAATTCLPNLQVPVVERFFAGGRSTHRAFPLDGLAIEGETQLTLPERGTVILGGNGLLLGNLELRVPLGSGWGASVFLDAGNVWSDYRQIHLRDLRLGAGLGVHYLTPVGPIRLEYGWKLDRQQGESPGELGFSIGFPF